MRTMPVLRIRLRQNAAAAMIIISLPIQNATCIYVAGILIGVIASDSIIMGSD